MNLLPQNLANIFSIALTIAFIFNIGLAFVIIFLERRGASSTWAWLMILFFLPVIGFFIYLLFGRQIRRKKIFSLDETNKIGIEHYVDNQLKRLNSNQTLSDSPEVKNNNELIRMMLTSQSAFLTTNNHITILTDGKEKFDSLIADILAAQHHIHIQYYIFKKDGIGQRIIDALEIKLKEGLEVKMLYDDMGSRTLTLSKLKDFKNLGGHVESFFPSLVPLINFRLNNRNHRKIVVIDGLIGYVGGFNVGDEYLGLDRKFGYWRDTHLRIEGSAVNALQLRFMMDWNSQSSRNSLKYSELYFPTSHSTGDIGMQIVSSGPDDIGQQIKYGYLKMINSAKERIYIQSPYFIPDKSFLEALKIAILSGVEVYIMIPNKPDHPFVYWATYSNVGDLMKLGAKIYIYDNGFIHTKMVVIDDEVSSVGTANMDVRSFELNFEVNAFIYDKSTAIKLRKSFEDDIKVSTILTNQSYNERSTWIKIKESLAQLISPIL